MIAFSLCPAAPPLNLRGGLGIGGWHNGCLSLKSTSTPPPHMTVPRSFASIGDVCSSTRQRRPPSWLPREGPPLQHSYSQSTIMSTCMTVSGLDSCQSSSENSGSVKRNLKQFPTNKEQRSLPRRRCRSLPAARGLLHHPKQAASGVGTSKSGLLEAVSVAAVAMAGILRSRISSLAKHSGMLLLPPLGSFRIATPGWSHPTPVECAASSAHVAEPAVAAVGRSIRAGGREGLSLLQGIVRSEAILSAAVLVAAPVLLRSWARLEADHHDTLDCRNTLQTYLIAGSGWICAVLATVAGNPAFSLVLQVAWRVAAARSLWTWSDLGRDLTNTPGWLHASVSRWRRVATCFAIAGAAARLVVMLAAATGVWPGAAAAMSSPTLDFLPPWLIRVASASDESSNLSAAQLCLGVGVYAWVAYYACFFLPYRVLYDEYQSYQRRIAQIVKDMGNGQEENIVLSTKLGPEFPKHLKRRMDRMPPGNDRDVLRLAGIVRQRSCSHTVVKASMNVKNKEGKYGVKMVPLKFGDLRYWGSDLFERLEQQERRDKMTGWTPPAAPGSGRFKYNRVVYARILREIKVALGKSDADVETDPLLSMSNLMHFDPDAEEGDFDLIMQEAAVQSSSIDAKGENLRMNNPHEMVVTTDSTPADRAREAGVPLDILALSDVGSLNEGFGGDGGVEHQVVETTDSVHYNSEDTAGQALEESIRSRASQAVDKADKMTPGTASRDSKGER